MDGFLRYRRLPHWDVDDGIYFVTACLKDSISALGLLDLYRYRDQIVAQRKPDDLDSDEWELRQHKLIFARYDSWIDTNPKAKWLENPDVANIVQYALLHFADIRYDLIANVVMPSHFHWVFHPRSEWFQKASKEGDKRWPRECIMKSIKGFTARRCNKILKVSGSFWQDESWDHVVRNEEELERIVKYVEYNPVKANLAKTPQDWPWSSAHDRQRQRPALGMK